MNSRKYMSQEAFNELIDNFEVIERLTSYGRENIKYHVQLLQQENQVLKNQLENCYCNRTDCSAIIKDSKKYDSLVQRIENQQKEFVEWLEAYIEDRDKVRKLHDEYSLSEERLSSQYFILQQVLSKYKEIIGDKDES